MTLPSSSSSSLSSGSLSNNSPIGKFKWYYTDPEPWRISTGGYSELDSVGIKSLTLQTSQQTRLMSFKDPITDFICLPSSPFPSGQCVCVCVCLRLFSCRFTEDVWISCFNTN